MLGLLLASLSTPWDSSLNEEGIDRPRSGDLLVSHSMTLSLTPSSFFVLSQGPALALPLRGDLSGQA